jgi:hypothetical protein
MNSPLQRETVKVFVSYTSRDKQIAQRIVDILKANHIDVWFAAYELRQEDSIADTIGKAISSRDYLIVLLSPAAVEAPWVQTEINAGLIRELRNRDITVLPVLLADCEIPPVLADIVYLDLRTDFDQGMMRLVQQLKQIPELDFSLLTPSTFEQLIADLLKALGFRNISSLGSSVGNALPADIVAEYPQSDPFGVTATEMWLVTTKLYKGSRVDLYTLQELSNYLNSTAGRAMALLITNGYVTSVAEAWLKNIEDTTRGRIRLIDGTELKRLLIQHPDIVRQYFTRGMEPHGE